MTVSRTGTTPTPFGFVGKGQYQTDSDSGLMLLGHRYYDASVGRFISSDPAKAGDNWYAYCDNNPLMHSDPEGLSPADDLWKKFFPPPWIQLPPDFTLGSRIREVPVQRKIWIPGPGDKFDPFETDAGFQRDWQIYRHLVPDGDRDTLLRPMPTAPPETPPTQLLRPSGPKMGTTPPGEMVRPSSSSTFLKKLGGALRTAGEVLGQISNALAPFDMMTDEMIDGSAICPRPNIKL